MEGVPHLFRDTDFDIPEATDQKYLEILIRRQIERLREKQDDYLIERDEKEQDLASVGLPVSEDAESRRLRRYQTALRKEWDKAQHRTPAGPGRA